MKHQDQSLSNRWLGLVKEKKDDPWTYLIQTKRVWRLQGENKDLQNNKTGTHGSPSITLLDADKSCPTERRKHYLSEIHCIVWEEGMDNRREWMVLGMNWI